MKNVNMIIAMSNNGVVGQGLKLPWHHKGDMQHFKDTTMNNVVLMGYPTFYGMATSYGKPGKVMLPGRLIVVVGRQPFDSCGIDTSNVYFLEQTNAQEEIENALSLLGENQQLFISGGARIYQRYIQFVDKAYITIFDFSCEVDHDTVFLSPEIGTYLTNHLNWRSITTMRKESDATYYVNSKS